MPIALTIGDESTNYQTKRKNATDCGKTKDMIINPSRRCGDTFTKLQSNCIGDPYIDPGQYYLRRGTSAQPRPFMPSGSNKLVKKSEFEHMHNGPAKRRESESRPGFFNRKNYLPFTSKIEYICDPYERKQDNEREKYAADNSKILFRDLPFASHVKQRGTFYDQRRTFGTDKTFPEKPKELVKDPLFGAFKKGDPLHTGYNKTIGPQEGYMEEREQDNVVYQKNVKKPVWRETINPKSMANTTISNNFRNVNAEVRNHFG